MKPPFKNNTILWIAPFVFLIMGLSIIFNIKKGKVVTDMKELNVSNLAYSLVVNFQYISFDLKGGYVCYQVQMDPKQSS